MTDPRVQMLRELIAANEAEAAVLAQERLGLESSLRRILAQGGYASTSTATSGASPATSGATPNPTTPVRGTAAPASVPETESDTPASALQAESDTAAPSRASGGARGGRGDSTGITEAVLQILRKSEDPLGPKDVAALLADAGNPQENTDSVRAALSYLKQKNRAMPVARSQWVSYDRLASYMSTDQPTLSADTPEATGGDGPSAAQNNYSGASS